jgi:outer membrane immunogenic protein
MKRMCVAGLIMLAANALAGAAAAADLGTRYPQQPYVKAPLYTPPFSWTGFYLGLNGGGGWGSSTWDRTGSFDLSGGVIGGTAGFNWQTGPAVFGLEGDMDWSGVSGTTVAGCAAGCTTKNDWLGTARGRAGYAFDRFLPYITGGLAFGDIRASTPGFAGASQTNLGWTIGAGVEAAIVGNWSAKAEYLHVDLGSFNCGLSCGPTSTDNVSLREELLRGGVNYRF